MGRDRRLNIEAAKSKAKQEKLFRVAVIVGVGVALLGYVMIYFIGQYGQVYTLHSDPTVSSHDLKHVFFSGEPWLIQCVNDEVPLHPASIVAAKNLASIGTKVGSLRCLDQLPSGKNFFQRFGFADESLPDKDHPLFFLFANLDSPKRPKGADLRNTTTIVNFAARESTPSLFALKNEKDFAYHCVKRRTCIVLLANGEVDENKYSWVVKKHRTVRIVKANANHVALSFLEKIGISDPKAFSVDEPKVLVLRSTLSDEEAKAQKLQRDQEKADREYAKKKGKKAPKPSPPFPKPFGVYVHNGKSDESSISSLISSHVSQGDAKSSEWVAVVDPTASSTKREETSAEKQRRARREEARRKHRARQNGEDDEISDNSQNEAPPQFSSREQEEEEAKAARESLDLDLDDDEVVVTDDEEEENS